MGVKLFTAYRKKGVTLRYNMINYFTAAKISLIEKAPLGIIVWQKKFEINKKILNDV